MEKAERPGGNWYTGIKWEGRGLKVFNEVKEPEWCE